VKRKTSKKTSKQAKSSGGLKMALLMHGEKMVIGLTAVFVVWLIYGTTQLESLTEQRAPAALQKLAGKAQDNIKRLNFGSFPDEKKLVAKDYDRASVMQDVEPASYATGVALNPPEFPRKTPRQDPKLFPLDDLEVAAGVGLFAYKDASAGDPDRRRAALQPRRKGDRKRKRSGRFHGGGKDEEAADTAVGTRSEDSELQRLVGRHAVRLPAGAVVKGRYWAAVMAKVPWSKQLQEYQRTFRDAEYYHPAYDVPAYFGYVVERAEIGNGEKLVWKVVQQITPRSLDKIISHWAGELTEPADPRYVDKLLTFPLPIRAEKPWDDTVLHSAVPRARPQTGFRGEEPAAAEVDDNTPRDGKESAGGFDAFEREAADPARPGRLGRGEEDIRRGPGGGTGRATRGSPLRSRREQVSFLFFRFIDFSVQPGKQYKYRVRLALDDPNDVDRVNPPAAIPSRYLSDKVIARRSKLKGAKLHFRLTDWSAPSPIISVPYPGWLLAGAVKAARPQMHYVEPSAAIIVQMLNLQQGLEGVTEISKMRRGNVGNFVKTTKVIAYRRSGPTVRQEDNFTFQTNTVLLDMRGGEGLSRRDRELTAPGEVLLLDPSGRMIVRTEQSDREEFARLRRMLEAAKQHRSRGKEEKKTERSGEGGLFGQPGGGGGGGKGSRQGRRRRRR